MYPEIFTPNETELFKINGRSIEIPKCNIVFEKWTGLLLQETFGGKPVLNVNEKPMFAELAITNYFQLDGWEARWVETYGKREPICLIEWQDDKFKNQTHVSFVDQDIRIMLEDISKINGNSYAGCWDVVGKKEGRIVFAESKRKGKDRIQLTQINWLKSALQYGLKPENFLLVQWHM